MKSLPFGPLRLAAAAGAVAFSLWASHRAQRAQIAVDSSERFPTWKGEMPLARAMKVGGRRRPVYRRRFRQGVKRGMSSLYRSFVRMSGPFSVTAAAVPSAFVKSDVTLSMVQTSDLTAVYRLYRIKKVVLHLAPRLDPAQATSTTVQNITCLASFACDPEGYSGAASTLTNQIVTAYDNSYSKILPSGAKYRYTFYPKVVNAVGNAGATAYVGSYATNPWLQLNAGGVAIPHQQLIGLLQTGSNNSQVYDYYLEIHFDVKGVA